MLEVAEMLDAKNTHFSSNTIGHGQSKQPMLTAFVALTEEPHTGQTYFLTPFFLPLVARSGVFLDRSTPFHPCSSTKSIKACVGVVGLCPMRGS